MFETHKHMNVFLDDVEKIKNKPGALMPILQLSQYYFGCVPIEIQKMIAKKLKLSISKVNAVVTFYSQFSIEPKGAHIVSVCMGTACYVRGAKEILDAFESHLMIKTKETTKDGNFTLEATRCVGACGLAPVFV